MRLVVFAFLLTATTTFSSASFSRSRPSKPAHTMPKATGSMQYVTMESSEMYIERDLSGNDRGMQGVTWAPTDVEVKDGRGKGMTLTRNGFQMIESPISSHETIDFYNQKDIVERYHPLCQELLKDYFKTNFENSGDGVDVDVVVFDHNVRSTKISPLKESGNAVVQSPAHVVHGDYTAASAPNRLERLSEAPRSNDVYQLIEGQESLLDPNVVKEVLDGKRRFAIINIWRNISRQSPVLRFPLACMDAQTFQKDDLRTFQIRYTDRIGENYFCCPSPKHEWYYFPQLVHNEALLLKTWDSAGDFAQGSTKEDGTSDVSTFSVHSAFEYDEIDDPPPRESIEVRCIVIWPSQ